MSGWQISRPVKNFIWKRLPRLGWLLHRLGDPTSPVFWELKEWPTVLSKDDLFFESLTDREAFIECTVQRVELYQERIERRYKITLPFNQCVSYRVTQELSCLWLSQNSQRAGNTFVVDPSPWIRAMKREPLWQDSRRELVIYTNEEVIEFLADAEPSIEFIDETPMPPIVPAKSTISGS